MSFSLPSTAELTCERGLDRKLSPGQREEAERQILELRETVANGTRDQRLRALHILNTLETQDYFYTQNFLTTNS